MNTANKLIANIEGALLGKPEAVRLAVTCFLSEGHLLIDDIPGVGKTTLAVALTKSIGCSFQRIQFTSDLLPSDILGVSVYNSASAGFDYKPGPVFHNVVLADEINRASPKTQSALLEAMQERQVSVDNHTRDLPKPFFVIATQNPHEQHGTFPLPESQLDRFTIRLDLGYPDEHTEARILRSGHGSAAAPEVAAVATVEDVLAEQARARAVRVDESLDRYIVSIARATRASALVTLGLSPRGALALRSAAKAFASIAGRDYALPDDVKAVAPFVMNHRLRLRGHMNGNAAEAAAAFIAEILDQVPVPV